VEVGEETSEEGKIKMDLGTGDVPVHEVGGGGGGSIFEDYPGDSFEKVGEINLEEDPREDKSLLGKAKLLDLA